MLRSVCALTLFVFLLPLTLSASCTFTRPLASGDTGDDVSCLQDTLRNQGFFTYPTSTGFFGPLTKDALISYQRSKGITPTGTLGPITTASLTPQPLPSLPTSRDEALLLLQSLLEELNDLKEKLSLLQEERRELNRDTHRDGEHFPGGTPDPDTTAPSISSFTVSNPQDRDIDISFTSSETLGTILLSITGSATTSLTESDFTPSGLTYEATYTPLSDGTYTLTLTTAEDLEGNDGASSENDTIEIDTTAPGVPGSFSATSTSDTEISLTWTTSSGDLDGYQIDWSPNGTSSWSTLSGSPFSSSATSTTHTSLTPETTYYYRIRSFDDTPNYSSYATSSAVTEDDYTPARIVRVDTSNGGTVRIYDSEGSLLSTPASPTTLPSSGFDLAIDEGAEMLYVSNQANGTSFRSINLSSGTNTQLEPGQGIAVDPNANGGAGYLWSGYSNSQLFRFNLALTSSSTVGTNLFNIRYVEVDPVLLKVYVVSSGGGSSYQGLHEGDYGGPFTRIINTSTGRSIERDPATGYNYFLNSTTLYEVIDGVATSVWAVPVTYVGAYQVLVDSEAGYAYVHGMQSPENIYVFDRYDWPSMTGRTTLFSPGSNSTDRFILYPY